MAKWLLGTMVGLTALTVLSLFWMAHRVHKRGALGGKTSAALRSLYPLVLGLGGWFLGALVVLTALPAVPLDDALLVNLSVGIPIGLGMYWAWVHRDWSGVTKTAGFVGALSGALIGAWLGFNASAGFTAIFTTIVGAALGANLTLILLDITRDLPPRSRLADAGPDADPLPVLVGRTAPDYGRDPATGFKRLST